MKGERLWVHPGAIEEAQAAYEWYHARSPEVADAFMNELDRGIEKILERPSQWAPYAVGTRRYPMHRFPFRLSSAKQTKPCRYWLWRMLDVGQDIGAIGRSACRI